MKRNTVYSTQLAKGAGMINETLALLAVFREGMDKPALLREVLEYNYLSTSTELRARDIVGIVFYQRFMRDNPALPLWLQRIRQKGLPLKIFSQLLMVYCARQHAVLYDAVTQVLNPHKRQGDNKLPADELRNFTRTLVAEGKAEWSERLQKKNAGYVRSTLIDFGLLNAGNEILPYELADFTLLYLMYELHFQGLSDRAIWKHEDWGLFNLSPEAVLNRIMGLSLKGGYIAQTSGDLLLISWNYKTMEEMIDASI